MNKLKILVALNMIAKRTEDKEILGLVEMITNLLEEEILTND